MSTASVPSTDDRLMTADELLERSAELGHCELVRGRLVRMTPPGGFHGEYSGDLAFFLNAHVRKHGLGKVLGEAGFVLERQPDTVRAPDVAFITAARLTEARTPRYITVPPDLAVEINSPNDRISKITDKVRWWLRQGVREVWVVDPETATVTTHAPDGRAHVYGRDDTLPGGEVLPGFALPLAELFTDD